jgi:hypothetical protein
MEVTDFAVKSRILGKNVQNFAVSPTAQVAKNFSKLSTNFTQKLLYVLTFSNKFSNLRILAFATMYRNITQLVGR